MPRFLLPLPSLPRPVAASRRWLSRISRPLAAVGLLLAVGFLPGRAAEERVFRAGAAQGDITPALGTLIIGGFSPTPTSSVHDDLYVRVLVLDDGRQRLAFVVCDNLGVPLEVCDEAKRLAKEQSGLDGAHIMITATHTHSGPTSGTETSMGINGGRLDLAAPAGSFTDYQRFLARRIADTIQRAIDHLEPARIGWGAGQDAAHVFNRRWHVSDEALRRNPFGGVDTVRMNPPAGSPSLIKPAGPTDPEIPFFSIQARDGRPIAVLAAYSLHYVGGVPRGTVSADYFGLFSQRLAEFIGDSRQGPPFVGILANGTSGDVNNINFREKRVGRAPFEQMHRVANAVAAEVYRAYQTVEYHEWVPLDVRYEEPDLASRLPTPAMVQRAREVLARPANAPAWHSNELNYARRILQRAEAPATVRFPLQAFRIGDVAVMGLPVETFAEMGLELKAKAPFPHAFTLSMANAYYGYLPTVEQHKLGGYESWVGTNRIEVGAAPKITAALLRMAAEMQPR